MLRKFSIHEEGKEPVAFLYYDEETEEYTMDIINRDLDVNMPAIIKICVQLGKFHLDHKEAFLYVKEHVIPPDRAGMDYILKKCGFPYYKEIFFLEKFRGKSVMDEFYADEIK